MPNQPDPDFSLQKYYCEGLRAEEYESALESLYYKFYK